MDPQVVFKNIMIATIDQGITLGNTWSSGEGNAS